MNYINIREIKLNWKKIIDLALDRLHWGKTYVMYTSQTATISCIMKEFNFEDSCAWFKINIDYVYRGVNYTETTLIRYLLNNFTIDDFKMHLNKKLITLLETVIENMKKQEAKANYVGKKYYSWEIKEKNILTSSYAEDYAEIKNISNDVLQEKCLDELNELLTDELNAPYNQFIETHMNHNKIIIVGVSDILKRIKDDQ